MPDSVTKKLIELIATADTENPELRRAATLVAGAVGSTKDRGLIEALLGVLEDPDSALRITALDALGRLQAEEALPRVIEFVKQGGVELEAAVRTAGHFGARGAKAIDRKSVV